MEKHLNVNDSIQKAMETEHEVKPEYLKADEKFGYQPLAKRLKTVMHDIPSYAKYPLSVCSLYLGFTFALDISQNVVGSGVAAAAIALFAQLLFEAVKYTLSKAIEFKMAGIKLWVYLMPLGLLGIALSVYSAVSGAETITKQANEEIHQDNDVYLLSLNSKFDSIASAFHSAELTGLQTKITNLTTERANTCQYCIKMRSRIDQQISDANQRIAEIQEMQTAKAKERIALLHSDYVNSDAKKRQSSNNENKDVIYLIFSLIIESLLVLCLVAPHRYHKLLRQEKEILQSAICPTDLANLAVTVNATSGMNSLPLQDAVQKLMQPLIAETYTTPLINALQGENNESKEQTGFSFASPDNSHANKISKKVPYDERVSACAEHLQNGGVKTQNDLMHLFSLNAKGVSKARKIAAND
jgi:hypothetical protein